MITIGTEDESVIRLSAARRGPIAQRARSEGPDPMAGITNLVDVMLVFACGLILAIVAYWNIDLPHVVEIANEKDLVPLEDVEEVVSDVSGSSYSELGTVYEDLESGKRYLIETE